MLHVDFMLSKVQFNQIKSEEDRLRRWTSKWFLSDFYGQSLICEFILALVSLLLLVNSIKEPTLRREGKYCRNLPFDGRAMRDSQVRLP